MPAQLTRQRLDPDVLRVYLVIDPEACAHDPAEIARLAISQGIQTVQWRAKRHSEKPERLRQAEAVQARCANAGALFIINDDVDLAARMGADGAHIGQDDVPPAMARERIGTHAILGLSVRSMAEARALDPALVDYAGVYPIFRSQTKADIPDLLSLGQFADICRALAVPAVAIGGITKDNAAQVITAGAHGVAVVSAICGADDPREAARDLVHAVNVAFLRR